MLRVEPVPRRNSTIPRCTANIESNAGPRVKAHGGSAGVDGLTFEQIEKEGVGPYLREIQSDLQERRYRPSPVLRRYIEKANGKVRPLAISTMRDRILQMACKMVIEPIFEADFENCSYGFRPKKSAHQAIQHLRQHLRLGCKELWDCDLSQYFDTIPHAKLMQLVERRISDRDVLWLIRLWLKAPIAERTERGKIRYIGGGKRNKRGTPQGGVISRLLANIYLHELDREFYRTDGPLFCCGARIVRYADDFVVVARYIGEPIKRAVMAKIKELGLALYEEKTGIVRMAEESFDFLVFTYAMIAISTGAQADT